MQFAACSLRPTSLATYTALYKLQLRGYQLPDCALLFVACDLLPAACQRLAHSMPRRTISLASGTSKSGTTWPSEL